MKTDKKILIVIVFSCLYLATQTALAAREYLVELVVFSNLDIRSKENWQDSFPPLDPKKMDRAVVPSTITPSGTAGAPTTKEIEESKFNTYVDRIRRNGSRKILVEARWVQEVSGPADTTIVRVTDQPVTEESSTTGSLFRGSTGMARPTDKQWNEKPPLLDGFVNFFLDEYYALETDLRYTPPYRPSILDENPAGGPTSYRIHEQRKMKSGELNYYDHPYFGMVLLVTPVEATVEPPLKQPGNVDQPEDGKTKGTL